VRVDAAAFICACALPHGLVGQAGPTVRVELAGRDPPVAIVSMLGLVDDDRFQSAMRSGFPLYVEYRVRLRQSRSLWDRTVSEAVLEYVILYDPVRQRFVLEDADGTEIFPDLEALRGLERRVVRFQGFDVGGPGEFYFHAAVSARTLEDEDVDEVFGWLKGEHPDSIRRNRPGIVTRAARRLLVQVAPLPRVTLEAETERFRVVP
jgi:hypothetical protein